MISRNRCALVLILLGFTASASSQTIKSWYFVTTRVSEPDSCRVVANLSQLEAILVPAGWTRSTPLPSVDWSKSILLVTSANQDSQPGAIDAARDGSRVWIRLDPANPPRWNSGVFLLVVDSPLVPSKACAVFHPERPKPSGNSNANSSRRSTTSTNSRTQAVTE